MPVEIIDDREEKDIYENDMKPQTRTIKANTGKTAADWLKARSGNLHVYDTLAIVKQGVVQWITKYDTIPQTLEHLLERPDATPKELLEEVQEPPETEQDVINVFTNADVLEGEYKHEVEVGTKLLEDLQKAGKIGWKTANMMKNMVSRSIDLVCFRDETVWVIEAKQEINTKAIGQVLLYEQLFKEDHPETEKIKKVIISGPPANYIDRYKFQKLEETCKVYNIEVFIKERDF